MEGVWARKKEGAGEIPLEWKNQRESNVFS